MSPWRERWDYVHPGVEISSILLPGPMLAIEGVEPSRPDEGWKLECS